MGDVLRRRRPAQPLAHLALALERVVVGEQIEEFLRGRRAEVRLDVARVVVVLAEVRLVLLLLLRLNPR